MRSVFKVLTLKSQAQKQANKQPQNPVHPHHKVSSPFTIPYQLPSDCTCSAGVPRTQENTKSNELRPEPQAAAPLALQKKKAAAGCHGKRQFLKASPQPSVSSQFLGSCSSAY